jgi:hypothetical protein
MNAVRFACGDAGETHRASNCGPLGFAPSSISSNLARVYTNVFCKKGKGLTTKAAPVFAQAEPAAHQRLEHYNQNRYPRTHPR